MANVVKYVNERKARRVSKTPSAHFVNTPMEQRPALAVFTSGGDSQGMNAAVRGTVRMGIYCGFRVFFVMEGYEGMIADGEAGQNLIVEAKWNDVSGVMQQGGTVIGSARSARFRTREGRLLAARNLVRRGITNLVVIGGDGSLTGADLFRQEWTSLLEELVGQGEIEKSQQIKFDNLHVVGMVGSIDNDFCGTDMTIGTNSALHRIMEAVDAISTTAQSHQRCFVLEVMGRHCGYLALVSAMASEADFLFIPEQPPGTDWPDKLCKRLQKARERGQRLNIIILSEGAIDLEGNAITANQVKDVIIKTLKFDTRVTVLGHVQRGGSPSAFDRLLGCRMAAEAVLALVDARENPALPSVVVSLDGNQAVRLPLMECVEKTKAVNAAIVAKDFALAQRLRGSSFNNNLITYQALSKLDAPPIICESAPKILILMVGAPACGANACIRAFVRSAITNGFCVVAATEGFVGLVQDPLQNLSWTDVRQLNGKGGSYLGTRRNTPEEVGLEKIAGVLSGISDLSGIMLIGGFESYLSVIQLEEAREQFPIFNVPILMAPCTISNNVPGTEFSIGSDTALNEITTIIDKIKQSAVGTKKRVFVVETMGGYCGYLATLAGLAGGADAAYIPEETFSLSDMLSDVRHLKRKMEDVSGLQRGLILRNELASNNFSTDFVYRLFSEEGMGCFDCRVNVLGHMQQGGVPTPFDRNLGTKFGVKAADWFLRMKSAGATGPETACVVGIIKRNTVYQSVRTLSAITDFKLRRPEGQTQWWLRLRPLLRILAQHDSLFESDSVSRSVDAQDLKEDEEIAL